MENSLFLLVLIASFYFGRLTYNISEIRKMIKELYNAQPEEIKKRIRLNVKKYKWYQIESREYEKL